MGKEGAGHTKDTPGVIAPPPLIALVTLALGLLLDWMFPTAVLREVLGFWPRIIVGGALFAVGGLAALMAERTFHRVGTNVPPWKPALVLAIGGIYEKIRNPMYMGLGLLVGGIGVALNSGWTLVLLVPAALLMHYGVVLREERYLSAKFGEPYRAYLARVPRYGLGRPGASVPSQG